MLRADRAALARGLRSLGRQPLRLAAHLLLASYLFAVVFVAANLAVAWWPAGGVRAGLAALAAAPRTEATLFIAASATAAEGRALGPMIEGIGGVAGAQFVAKDDAFAELNRRADGQGIAGPIGEFKANPLPDAYVVSLSGRTTAELAATAAALRKLPKVDAVQLDTAAAARRSAGYDVARQVVIVLIPLAVALALAVVGTLAAAAARFDPREVAILRTVGAEPAYLTRPSALAGAFCCALVSICGIALGTAALAYVRPQLTALTGVDVNGGLLLPAPTIAAIIGTALAVGYLIGGVAARLRLAHLPPP